MPCTGSTRKSATSSRCSSCSSASRSPKGTRVEAGQQRAEALRRTRRSPFAESEPSVSPWKPCSAERTRERPVGGAAELERRLDRLGSRAREEARARAARASARAAPRPSRPGRRRDAELHGARACRARAPRRAPARMRGLLRPTLNIPKPPSMSRKRWPSESQRYGALGAAPQRGRSRSSSAS